jgi:hypothetical protein
MNSGSYYTISNWLQECYDSEHGRFIVGGSGTVGASGGWGDVWWGDVWRTRFFFAGILPWYATVILI